jgi:hypothetical protein
LQDSLGAAEAGLQVMGLVLWTWLAAADTAHFASSFKLRMTVELAADLVLGG